MCRESIQVMKACGKMPSEVRLEKNWGTSVDKRAIYYKTLHFLENLENSLCCPNFPVLYLNSLCFPYLEKVITKFPAFPVPWPSCYSNC